MDITPKGFFFLIVASSTLFISSVWAFLLGVCFALLLGNPYSKTSATLSKKLLQICVVGLGFGIHATTVLAVGYAGILLSISSIILTLIVGIRLGRRLQLSQPLSLLISSGTAICGGSAIAAVASVIHAKSQEITLALSTIFGLNALALFVFPALGHWLNLSDEQFGLWAAIAIHDTSSVVGAAEQFSDKALAIATTVKLQRTLWIIPLVFIIAQTVKKGSRTQIPWFILCFILAMSVHSFFPATHVVTDWFAWGAKKGLALTLFLIGANFQMSVLRQVGSKPVILGSCLWILISVFSLMVILALPHYGLL